MSHDDPEPNEGKPARGTRDERSAGRAARDGGAARGRDRGGRAEGRSGSESRSTRGGTNGERAEAHQGPRGPRAVRRRPGEMEPTIPEGVTGHELDRAVRQQLRTLTKENAEGVAQHLVMVATYLAADDLDAAQAHAETAVRRAGRVGAAREALGMVAYRRGDFARALSEFRTARRLTGTHHLLPLMVDCERGLGRHARALELAASPEVADLADAEKVELAIVVAGVRRDLGQEDAALVALQIPQLRRRGDAHYRLYYAYGDLLASRGEVAEAREWLARAATGDTEGETDAVERVEELDGTTYIDLDPDTDTEGEPTGQEETPSGPTHPHPRSR